MFQNFLAGSSGEGTLLGFLKGLGGSNGKDPAALKGLGLSAAKNPQDGISIPQMEESPHANPTIDRNMGLAPIQNNTMMQDPMDVLRRLAMLMNMQ